MIKKYKVTFTTGFSMIINLRQQELKNLIHNYKVTGYEIIREEGM